MTGLIFIIGVTATFLVLARLLFGEWAIIFRGIGWFLLMLLVGAVACGVVFGIIGLWAYISMALTGNLS